MSNINVNPNPAGVITADTTTVFSDFVNKVAKESYRSIAFGNGNSIELEPDSAYTLLKLKVSAIATTEQFNGLLPYLMQGVVEATKAGIIPEDWLQDITTALDIHVPAVPEQYVDDEHEIKMLLMGNTHLLPIRKQK